MLPDRNPTRIHGEWRVMAALPQQQVQKLFDRRQPSLVIEAVEVRIVAEPAADLGRAEPGFERHLVCGTAEEFRQRLIARLRRSHCRPIRHQPTKYCRPTARNDLRLEALAISVLKFGDRLHRARGSSEGIASLGAPR